jgi:hypothetical protein
MHPKERHIRDGLKRIAGKYGPLMLLDGEVTAVDSTNYFCDVALDTDPTAVISQCRLRAASIGNQSIDMLPAIGSEVVIAKVAEDDYLVLAIDQITSYRITVNNMVFTITESGFSITNGTTSLKDILTGFVTEMLAIYAPKDVAGINNLTTLIDGLLA